MGNLDRATIDVPARKKSEISAPEIPLERKIGQYGKKKIDFIQRQNSHGASKLTIKKYFSRIKAGISLS